MATNPESSEVTTRPPRAQLTPALVQPPARVYLTLDDQLYIRSRNSLSGVVLRIAGRMLTPDGEIVPFNYTHTPATDRTASLEAFRLAEGYLLSAVVFPSSGAPVRGETFVELGFLRGIGGAGDVVDVLAKDYVAEAEPLAFPGSPIRSSVEGPGAIRSITGTDPAANTEFLETVPTDARWQFISVRTQLVTDANAANRLPILVIDDGANELEVVIAANAVPASTAATLTWATGVGVSAPQVTGQLMPIASEAFLSAGFRISSTTVSLQVGDNWAAPQLHVLEWIED